MDLELKRLRRLIIAFLLIALGQVSPACAQEQQKTGIKIEAQAQSVPVKPKLAIAIGGGGLRSASAIGVLKALEDEGITIDIITGTSMGAVVGGLYAAGVTPIHIEEEFTQKKLMHAFLTIPLKLRVMVIPLFYTPRLIGIEPYDGLYRGKRFATYLNKQVPVTEHNIEDLKIPFGAVAVSLLDGKAKTIKSGNLGKALQASCAIPALRKPVKLGGDLFVDGGALVNLPVMQARELGGDIVVAINVDEKIENTDEQIYHKVGSVAHRVVEMHLNHIDKEQKRLADYVIEPEIGSVGMISTSAKDARACIDAGTKAGHSAAPAIRELLKKYGRN
jgi:NTE family protein